MTWCNNRAFQVAGASTAKVLIGLDETQILLLWLETIYEKTNCYEIDIYWNAMTTKTRENVTHLSSMISYIGGHCNEYGKPYYGYVLHYTFCFSAFLIFCIYYECHTKQKWKLFSISVDNVCFWEHILVWLYVTFISCSYTHSTRHWGKHPCQSIFIYPWPLNNCLLHKDIIIVSEWMAGHSIWMHA